jgi:hypothetical protein
MKSIIIDGIEYVPKEEKVDREPLILKETLHFEVYCEDLEPSNWNDAIGLCTKLGDGWRLPTILELQLMYQNKKLIGNLRDTSYWSSTEYSASFAWYFNFYDGYTSNNYKNNAYYVRAVRSINL